MKARSGVSLSIRTFEPSDEPAVLDLLRTSLGAGPSGERSAAIFRWKHQDNPFGRSVMLVAEDAGAIVGLRAFMRWRFVANERDVRAVRAVDTATHPDHQGRGVFKRLTLVALEALRGDANLIYNTPNEKSLPGYLKMGWRTVGRVPVRVRVRRPARFAARVRDRRAAGSIGEPPAVRAATASEVFHDDRRLERLVAEAERPDGLSTPRTVEYLRWRYGAAPGLGYRAVIRERESDAVGVAVFRVRPRGRLWETTLAELLVAPGDVATARSLVASVGGAADVDHVACSFPRGSAAERGALLAGALRAPGGMTLATHPLGPVEPDPTELRSWALSLGDLEVF